MSGGYGRSEDRHCSFRHHLFLPKAGFHRLHTLIRKISGHYPRHAHVRIYKRADAFVRPANSRMKPVSGRSGDKKRASFRPAARASASAAR